MQLYELNVLNELYELNVLNELYALPRTIRTRMY